MSQRAIIHPTLEHLVMMQYQARKFSFAPRQPVGSLLSGRYGSRLRGRGLTFEELREYRVGDDVRTMDWKATARLRKPYIRVYNEERERPILLVVDQRTSMFFGSARTTKATAAAEAAALAAWRGLQNGDRIGAILFGDSEMLEIKPLRQKSTVLRICHELVRMNELLPAQTVSESPARLNEAFRRAINVASHDHLVILITDFHGADPQTRKHATQLVAHNDALAMLIYDPLGASLPTRGAMYATDGMKQLEVPKDAGFDLRYRQAFRERCQLLRERLDSLRIPILPICTHEPVEEQIMSSIAPR